MLVLSRKVNEEIVIDGQITVTVIRIRGKQVSLGISAPPEVCIDRAEVRERRAGFDYNIEQFAEAEEIMN